MRLVKGKIVSASSKTVLVYDDVGITSHVATLSAIPANLCAGDLVMIDWDTKAIVQAPGAETVQKLTASGAITAGIQSIELSHTGTVIAATIANLALHPGLLVIKNTSASGTAAHTVTVTTGTLDGTNKVATLNAPKECLVLYVDSAGNGTIVANIGEVALS